MRHSTKEKLAALKNNVELPVDPGHMHKPGEYLATDEKAVLTLAREYQRAADPDYACVSWVNQVKAADFFNTNGLIQTLDEIIRVGGPEALG